MYLGFCEVGGGKVINSVHGPLAMDSGKKREFGTSATEPCVIQPASVTGKRVYAMLNNHVLVRLKTVAGYYKCFKCWAPGRTTYAPFSLHLLRFFGSKCVNLDLSLRSCNCFEIIG